MSLRLPRLDPDPRAPFPPPGRALREPNGLLAFGGGLEPERLLAAYRAGIFPWYSPGEPILWWSPDPRTCFEAARFRLARRLRRDLRGSPWQLSADRDFAAVIAACATVPRRGQYGTWITPEMQSAYLELHRRGHAHSVEVWEHGRLVGGIYGVAVGTVFCGESMFSLRSGASKVALAGLCRQLAAWGVDLLDAQVDNPHLAGLGAIGLPRSEYLERLARPAPPALPIGRWMNRFPVLAAVDLA
jgi:leucyl/phenylalanyl-tRNA---protein transferase